MINRPPSAARIMVRTAQLIAASCAACVLVACSSSAQDEPSPSSSTESPATSGAPATASPTAPAAKDDAVGAYCTATRAAGAAKSGTVGEDLAAVRAQAKATRALASLPDAPPGLEVFAKSADETAAVLEQLPAGDEVADVGLDPRFGAIAKKASEDSGYREFLTWTIQTCKLAPSGG